MPINITIIILLASFVFAHTARDLSLVVVKDIGQYMAYFALSDLSVYVNFVTVNWADKLLYVTFCQ